MKVKGYVITGSFCGLDEISLGIHMCYGQRHDGQEVHITAIGFLFFELSIEALLVK